MGSPRFSKSFFVVAAVALLISASLYAQPTAYRLDSFESFMANARAAVPADYMAQADSRVKDGSAFEDMRQHLLGLYDGITVTHSFLLSGHAFDCVPIEQQASLRQYAGNKVAAPPPTSQRMEQTRSEDAPIAASQAAFNAVDGFGNSTRCEAGTIPMRRVTLDDMTHFATLRDFFAKHRGSGEDGSDPMGARGNGDVHHYAFTQQNVKNLGGHSDLNLWKPYVNLGKGDAMSLSQHWYAGGSPNQTAEIGWQNQPAYWGTEDSVLFVYWTADNYQSTGCYNLECDGFVQVAGDWYFGSNFDHYSKVGGSQYYFEAEFYLYQGNWWLGLGGEWVGYYPVSIYGGGQMAHHATVVQYGGEVAGSGHWPPMGSGKWPSKGYKYAAYQDQVWYHDTKGNEIWTNLTLEQPDPKCYKDAGLEYDPTQFYFGGPGGGGC
ncbi:MAG TPA: neprosin family prolyl endopeptidase [Terriglobales bacterium]|nr:neprosin family prolyl endopeptidase [Terriglobales bacterium]